MNITHVGIDLAKHLFSVHGVDQRGRCHLRRDLRRSQMLKFFANLSPCVLGLEACASAHYWGQALGKLGHEVRLINPRFVTPYRKSDKNDRNDAEAICEALTRPSMRFVAVKAPEQQAVLSLHRARALLSTQRTALMNQIRGLLAEFGLIVAQGPSALRTRVPEILEDADNELPDLARETFAELYERWLDHERRLTDYDRRLQRMAGEDAATQRLLQLPGVGAITATALVASAGDLGVFRNGRQFAAWLGLVPRHYASAGKRRTGRITKRGDAYVRTLLVHGARAALRTAHRREDALSHWALALKERRGPNKAAVALAAKHARIIWAMLTREVDYQPRPVSA
jgi:transposase